MVTSRSSGDPSAAKVTAVTAKVNTAVLVVVGVLVLVPVVVVVVGPVSGSLDGLVVTGGKCAATAAAG